MEYHNVCSSIDVDECSSAAHDCHMFATCSNTMGSYTCTCNSGYEGDGRHCTGEFVYGFVKFCFKDSKITPRCYSIYLSTNVM